MNTHEEERGTNLCTIDSIGWSANSILEVEPGVAPSIENLLVTFYIAGEDLPMKYFQHLFIKFTFYEIHIMKIKCNLKVIFLLLHFDP